MKLSLFRHLWGVAAPWPQAFATFGPSGYVGVEATLHGDVDLLRSLCEEHGLRLSGLLFTSGATVAEHVDSLREQVDRWAALGAERVVAQSGSDTWPIAQAVEFYGRSVEIERAMPLPVAHETHRGRALFNPWATREVLTQVPQLRLCCDFSHWVCVAERLLGDCEAILALAARHCTHVHARVGHEQGPQVPDPSAPEVRHYLEAHESWWRMIWDAHRAAGRDEVVVVPEFGPPGYLATLPHTHVPVADLDRVVEWMSERLRQTFAVDR